MVKHIILWSIKEEYQGEEKEAIKKGIKEGLEGLMGKVPGLLEVHVYTEALPSSNMDVMLTSTCENQEALKVYANHEDHVKVANEKIKPFVSSRNCMDFEVS
ncbi:MAG: Dabb family protein [Lachnospiraceae bacterium]|nr:Dabb family protein [Lachnospiraceae bacterium]